MKNFIKTIILLLIANICLAQSNFIKDSLDIYINREMKRWNLPGLAIAIVKDGKVIVMKGYGVADVKKKTPVTENTVFQIASCSKAFTGTSLALLEYYGKLNLDDKVKKYLPYFKMSEDWRTEQITIRDVLSHRIGFGTFQSDFLNWNCNKSRKDLIANMLNVVPKYGLREHYGYCNLGFLTAGEIIPVVCDTTWDDYVKYHYFIPLEMKGTSSLYKDFMANANASKAYTMVDDVITELVPANVDKLGPAGSIT
ncbi:MAG TPA: serine hydrolase domain-containing protein, partial [Bacteroidia bacterium]|nr:serine hydrolase domain-containing protein [Bacteroidia bacterium]